MQKTLVYKTLVHLLIWGIFAWLSYKYLRNWLPQAGIFLGSLRIGVYSVVYTAVLSIAPYLSFFVLLPRFFFRKKYGWYAAWLLLVFAGVSYLVAGVDALFLLPYHPDWVFTGGHVFSRIPYLVLFTLLGNWSRLSEELYYRQQQETALRNAKTEAELRWLKAQVNPHFLFNALHNIYSLVYLKSDLAAPMLVKLADMMRYLFQDSQAEKVPVLKEIEYLDNYIQLQSLKKRWQNKISFETLNQAPGKAVEPLLFINFVENAFKHSNLDQEGAFVKIKLHIHPHEIYFKIENTTGNTGTKDKTTGIGLLNIKQRLELLYPQKYTLTLSHQADLYTAELILRNLPSL